MTSRFIPATSYCRLVERCCLAAQRAMRLAARLQQATPSQSVVKIHRDPTRCCMLVFLTCRTALSVLQTSVRFLSLIHQCTVQSIRCRVALSLQTKLSKPVHILFVPT